MSAPFSAAVSLSRACRVGTYSSRLRVSRAPTSGSSGLCVHLSPLLKSSFTRVARTKNGGHAGRRGWAEKRDHTSSALPRPPPPLSGRSEGGGVFVQGQGLEGAGAPLPADVPARGASPRPRAPGEDRMGWPGELGDLDRPGPGEDGAPCSPPTRSCVWGSSG